MVDIMKIIAFSGILHAISNKVQGVLPGHAPQDSPLETCNDPES